MHYTQAQVVTWLAKLEAQHAPQHRHHGIISVPWDADPAPYLEAAQAECQRHGCTYAHIICYTGVTPDNWAEIARLAQAEAEQLAHEEINDAL